MPWLHRNQPARAALASTAEELSADIRVLRSTVAAQASSIASLATALHRLDARVEAWLTNHPVGEQT